MTIFTPQLEIQKFLNSFQNLTTAQTRLKQYFEIDIKPDIITFSDGSTEQVWIYNYNLFEARGESIIENEARALILNRHHEIVSLSFPRFFNLNEENAANLDWKTTVLETKFDGSLIVVYGYKNEIFIQTRRSATASGQLNNVENKTYHNAVMDVLKTKNYNYPLKPFIENKNYINNCTCVFEYIGPDNRLVTPYNKADLVCLAVFRKDFAVEIVSKHVDRWCKKYGFLRPKRYGGFEGSKNAIDFVKSVSNPLDEGFVAVDGHNCRIKIKNPAFLSISRAVNAGNSLLPRHFAKIVLNGNVKETVSYFSEFANILLLMDGTLEEMIEELDNIWELNRNAKSLKEFAEIVKYHSLSHILFMIWKNKIKNFDDILQHIKPELLVTETKERHNDSYKAAIKEAVYSRGQKNMTQEFLNI
ncbi:MAG: hypothetical protein DRI84_09885 [Bacteroidetes bacterium]|nr:MAG: hypothetical protein DRI84_09885 [Bacteroidota bacterium]